jgi:Spy/CpxP family protein refolding chaperone
MSALLKPWLILATIFIAGMAAGGALTFALSAHFMHPPDEAKMQGNLMNFLTRRLDLTPDQQAKIQPIVVDATTQLRSLHREEIDHGAKIMKEADDKIAAILTPQQQAELQVIEKEREKMFSGHMHPWGAGPMHHHGGPDDGPPPQPQPAP